MLKSYVINKLCIILYYKTNCDNMKKGSFSGTVISQGTAIETVLSLYIFEENNMHIIYCPALDLSAAGINQNEAEMEFAKILELYVDYCLKKKTLFKDLEALGWKIKKKTEAQAPSIKKMLHINPTLQDIVYNKQSYRTFNHPLRIAANA